MDRPLLVSKLCSISCVQAKVGLNICPLWTSKIPPDYADMKPFAQALTKEVPDRIVWGSDWPHVMVNGPMPNDGDLCNQIADWIPNEKLRQKIFVDNPRVLYGFAD